MMILMLKTGKYKTNDYMTKPICKYAWNVFNLSLFLSYIIFLNRDVPFTIDWLNKQAPILNILSNPNIEQSSLFLKTFKRCMQWQNENYVPPLSITIHQQILYPISNWCQLNSSTSSTLTLPSSSIESKSNHIMNRHDVLFTFWDNHDDEYPNKYYVDENCPSFNIATLLNHSS